MKPIIFSTEMVRAILEGRKTMTRRVITPQPCKEVKRFERFIETVDCGFEARFGNDTSVAVCDRKPKYKPGDILWVRETWYKNYPHEYGRYWYRADGEEIDMPTIYGGTVIYGKADGLKWRPSIHMPRKAARLFLLVKAVRVERLQDITEQDAIAEGALYTDFGTHVPTWIASLDGGKTYHPARPQQHNGWHMSPVNSPDQCYFTATSAFAGYWNRLNAKRGHSWDTSPWVWVIEFSRTEAPS